MLAGGAAGTALAAGDATMGVGLAGGEAFTEGDGEDGTFGRVAAPLGPHAPTAAAASMQATARHITRVSGLLRSRRCSTT